MKLSLCSGVTCLLVASQAFAQPPPGPMLAEEPNTTQSFLPNLLATSVGGTIDARFDYTNLGDSDYTLFALNVHAQYLTPGGGGGYVALPFAYISGENILGEEESQSGLGNLEVGGLYAVRQSPDTDILLRGGIALDTADDEDAGLIPIAQISPKLTDSLASGLATTWARAQVQFRHASGNMRLGAMGGFDLPIDGAAEEADGFDGVLNLAASLGFETPSFGLGFGFAYAQILTDEDVSDDSQFNFNATIDFPIGAKARLFGALGIPNVDDIDENDGDVWALGVGVRAKI